MATELKLIESYNRSIVTEKTISALYGAVCCR